jgi:WD40 repeat protein
MNSSADISVECSVQPLDFSFHRTDARYLAAGLVDGTIEVHDICDEEDTLVSSTAAHEKCRAVLFSENNPHILWSAGSRGDAIGWDSTRMTTFAAAAATESSMNTTTPTSMIRWRIPQASMKGSPIQVFHEISPLGLLVTGDEVGCIRFWDPRLLDTSSGETIRAKSLPMGCVAHFCQHEDYISDVTHSEDATTLLATSADGCLSIYDMRRNTNITMQQQQQQQQQPILSQSNSTTTSNGYGFVRKSDNQDDELLSIAILKHGKKVVCGTTEGVLGVFSFGTWGDVSDRFPGFAGPLDALAKVDEDTVLVGCSDGYIRLVSIHPDKVWGIVGDNHEGFPIEKILFNADRQYIGSLTHDPYIRLWDANLLKDQVSNTKDHSTQDVDMKEDAPATTKPKFSTSLNDSDDEWQDMDEGSIHDMNDSNDDDDDDDGSDEEEEKPKSQNEKRGNRLKTDTEKFFEDL